MIVWYHCFRHEVVGAQLWSDVMFAECELIIDNDYNNSVQGEYMITQLAYQNVYNNPIIYHYNIFYFWKMKKTWKIF